MRLIEAFARRLFAQRGKEEFSRTTHAAADGNNLRVKQIINRGAGGRQAVDILVKHGLCRFIAFFCAVDDELCIYILRAPARARGDEAFGVLFHCPLSVACQSARRAVGLHAAVVAAGTVLAAVYKVHVPELHALVHAAVEHVAA